MKTNLLFLLSLFSWSLIAQEYEYCTLKQVTNEKITLQKSDSQSEIFKDSEGKEIKDLFQAYLLMEQNKWEFAMSYVKPVYPQGGVIVIGEPVIPAIENNLVFKRKRNQGK